MKKLYWILLGLLSTCVGLYPIVYFVISREFGLLSTKSTELLNNYLWNIGFYGHIIFGGIALLIGWLQFSSKLRKQKPWLHINIGKVYFISVLISGISGLSISFYATGGIISSIGFLLLSIVWLSTTILGFYTIKKGNIKQHQQWMIYSYAACFSAVTLRIWLPLLTQVFDSFILAYQTVAWLAWIPNLIVAYFIIQKQTNVQIT